MIKWDFAFLADGQVEPTMRRVFHGGVGRTMHRLAGWVASDLHGVPVAAAVFEPNVIRAAGPGFMVLAVPFDWRRQDKAIIAGLGLAPTTLLVVTTQDVYAFDAGLLRWNAVRKIAEWPRAELVARAVPVPEPHPPQWAELRYRPYPSLRLESRSGVGEAEVRPVGQSGGAMMQRRCSEC